MASTIFDMQPLLRRTTLLHSIRSRHALGIVSFVEIPDLAGFILDLWALLMPRCVLDREVRKANRELNHQMNKKNDMDKIELLTKRSSELFANMKRLERENLKNKKRADQLQKEKDSSRTDLSKQISLKEKLEKLCRELQKENNKLKVLLYQTRVWESLS